jgi:hypothetical protein
MGVREVLSENDFSGHDHTAYQGYSQQHIHT